MSMKKGFYDIAIAGGGPVGLALAAACGGMGLRIAIIEPNAAAKQTTQKFDGRTIALAHQGVELLKTCGVWKHLQREANPMRRIRIADTHSNLKLDFDAAEVGHEAFGYMVENRHLRGALWARVQQLRNVDMLCPASVTSFDLDGSMAMLTLNNKTQLQAALFVAADGRTSPARAAAGIDTFGFKYAQHAVICTIDHSEPHDDIALEHFIPEGPFATLPMKGNRSGIVWTVPPQTAEALMALSDDDFIGLMRTAGADWLGDISIATPRATYPLQLAHAHTYTANHFALIGDAAHVMHPIAGQGFNMGLRDVACLVKLINEARTRGLRADDGSVLAQYEKQRRTDNQMMLAATDTIDRLFSNRIAPISAARKIGLALVDSIGPLRRAFIEQAMGLKAA